MISSPARPVQVTDGPAGDGLATGDGPATGDGLVSDVPAGDVPADVPAVDGSAGDGSASLDDPAPRQIASDSSALQFDDSAESDGPARHPAAGVDRSAGHGTPAGTTLVGGPDASVLTGTSSLLFPSIPTSINQATLIDFMSMWTLFSRYPGQPGCTVVSACSQT